MIPSLTTRMNREIKKRISAGSMSIINRIRLTCLIVYFLFSTFPVFVHAQASPLKTISHFQYELEPGGAIDDTLVVVNETADPKTFTVITADVRGGDGKSPFVYFFREAPLDLASWIRFLDSTIPQGSQEVIEALADTRPARYHQLCQAMKFGEIEKTEREQKLVKKLGRNLVPSEIQYLGELTEWCRGSEESFVSLEPFETVRIPFLLLIPLGAQRREYRVAFFKQTDGGGRELIANVREIVPGSSSGKLAINSAVVVSSNSTDEEYRILVYYTNVGGQAQRDSLSVVIERLFPIRSKTVLTQEVSQLPSGRGTANFVWKKPFFGSYVVSLSMGKDSEKQQAVFSHFFIPWIPVVVLVASVVILLMYGMGRMYWKRKWLDAVRKSWKTMSCEEPIRIARLAKLFGVSESLIAILNKVPTHYEFHSGDTVLLPPDKLISIQKRISRKKGRSSGK